MAEKEYQPKYEWKEMQRNGHNVDCVGKIHSEGTYFETAVWDSRVSDFLDLVHVPVQKKYPSNCEKWYDIMYERDSYSEAWQGMKSEEAIKRVDWPEGIEYMDKYLCDLDDGPIADSIKRVRTWSDDGDEFCRDRFDAGDPDCWRRTVRESSYDYKSGIVEMTVCFGGNCSRSAEDLIWGGAAAVLLIDKLEDAGYRVGVTGIHANGGLDIKSYDPLLIHKIAVKDPDQPLDIDTLLMALAAPWFFRVHVFRSYIEMPFEVGRGLGRTVDTPKEFYGKIHIDHIYSQNEAQNYLNEVAETFKEGRRISV